MARYAHTSIEGLINTVRAEAAIIADAVRREADCDVLFLGEYIPPTAQQRATGYCYHAIYWVDWAVNTVFERRATHVATPMVMYFVVYKKSPTDVITIAALGFADGNVVFSSDLFNLTEQSFYHMFPRKIAERTLVHATNFTSNEAKAWFIHHVVRAISFYRNSATNCIQVTKIDDCLRMLAQFLTEQYSSLFNTRMEFTYTVNYTIANATNATKAASAAYHARSGEFAVSSDEFALPDMILKVDATIAPRGLTYPSYGVVATITATNDGYYRAKVEFIPNREVGSERVVHIDRTPMAHIANALRKVFQDYTQSPTLHRRVRETAKEVREVLANGKNMVVTWWVNRTILKLLTATVRRALKEWLEALIAYTLGERAECDISTDFRTTSSPHGDAFSANIGVRVHPQRARIGVGTLQFSLDWSGVIYTNSTIRIRLSSQITHHPFRLDPRIARVECELSALSAHPSVDELRRAARELTETLMSEQIIGFTERLITYLRETRYAPLRAQTLPLRGD